MSRAVEYVNAAGLRQDGRRPPEHRRISVDFGHVPNCDGSCSYVSGSTRAVAYVLGPREVAHRGDACDDAATITCCVSVAAFSGDRRREMQRFSKFATELGSAVLQVAKSVVIASQYPGSQIQICVDLLQHDGCEKAACINAALMALIDASIAMHDGVFAVTAGFLDGKVVCDLTANEIRSQCPVLTLALKNNDPAAIVLFDFESRSSEETLKEIVDAASACIVATVQSSILPTLKTHASQLRVEVI